MSVVSAPLAAGARKARGDADLRDTILRSLDKAPEVVPASVGVAVTSGVVTLSGTVPDADVREIAVKRTHQVIGVLAVVDDLRLPAESREIEEALRAASLLGWLADHPGNDLHITVRNAHLLLSGTVAGVDYERAAREILQDLAGTLSASDMITIRSPAAPVDLEEQLLQELHQVPGVDTTKIRLAVDDGVVRVGGMVSTYDARHDAAQALWRHPAVKDVHRTIDVVPDIRLDKEAAP
ncbi:BON domain-containing protein [Humibacter sp. BT305]|nr:BON domain-containing protein [Humibacter sp. BT305]